MIKEMIPKQLDKRTITESGKYLIYEFDQVGELPKRKSKTPTVFAAKNLISSYFFEYIKGFHVPTHFVERESESSMKVKKTSEIPFEVVMRNTVTENFSKTYDLEIGTELVTPIMDFKFTDERFSDQFINESYICSFGYIQSEEMKILVKQAGKINAVMKSFFTRRNLRLDKLILRFARTTSNIVLASELSPDTMIVSEIDSSKKYRFNFTENYSLAFYERTIGF